MSVQKHKDGRWYVAGRKGFFPEEPNRTKMYFGRGREAELAAKMLDEKLGGNGGYDREFKPKKKISVREQLRELKTVIVKETYQRICEKIDQDREALHKKKGVNGAEPIHEADIVKDLIYRLAKSKRYNLIHVEVKTEHGFADIVTDKEIIEVKNIIHWKQAIGQVNAYHNSMPELQKRIHLFGHSSMRNIKDVIWTIKQECRKNNIRTTIDLI